MKKQSQIALVTHAAHESQDAHMKAIKLVDTGSYKTGMNEVAGLKEAITFAMAPILAVVNDKAYWGPYTLEEVEYLRRDGFIPRSHNCGGLEISVHVPVCEQYDFGFLEFGECDGCAEDGGCTGDDERYPNDGGECGYETNGDLDAFFRIRLKFEGIQDDGSLKFYLFAEGGNNDAPYFRSLPTLFESEFSCKSVAGLKRASSKAIKELLKLIK